MDKMIEVLTHASIRIGGSKVIYVDPFKISQGRNDADLILITHEHFDHFSPEDIQKVVKTDTIFVAPKTMEQQIAQVVGSGAGSVLLYAGEATEVKGIALEAVAAYNNGRPFHTKDKGWLGYVVTVDGTRIYIAGDTDENEDNQKVSCDVALVPIGGTYTMDAQAAAQFVNKLKPQIAIPIHYGNVAGSPEDAEGFMQSVASGITVKIKMQEF